MKLQILSLPVSRGVSILAALLVVGILSIAAAGINNLAPHEYAIKSFNQVASVSTGATPPVSQPNTTTPQNTIKPQLKNCHDELQYIGGQAVPTGKQICSCRQSQISATEIVTNICLPGCTLYTHPGFDEAPSTVQTSGDSKAFGKTASIESLKGSCTIYACPGSDNKGCTIVNDNAIGSGIDQKHIDAVTTAGRIQNADSPAQSQAIYSAYTGDKTELDKVLGENQDMNNPPTTPANPTTDNKKEAFDTSYLPIEKDNPVTNCVGLDPAQCAAKSGGGDMTTLKFNKDSVTTISCSQGGSCAGEEKIEDRGLHNQKYPVQADSTFNNGTGAGGPAGPSTSEKTGGLGNLFSGGATKSIASFLSGLGMGMMRGGSGGGSGSGSGGNTNQNCSPQYMCNDNALVYQNSSCQKNTVQQCPNGCNGNTCATQPVAPYGYGTDGKACLQPVAQLGASECSAGTWQSIPAGNGCAAAGWKCVASGTNGPTASIHCLPLSADINSVISIGFSCGNTATASNGTGFGTGGALSGTSTVLLARPQLGSSTIAYSLSCSGGGVVTSAQCTVAANIPSITLVSNPDHVGPNGISTIGWVTSGMQSCVASSPEQPDFTAHNQGYTSANGVAATSPITQTTNVHLHCLTVNGGARDTTTTVLYIAN